MKNQGSIIALEIALIMQKFSETDIKKAIDILIEYGCDHSLISYFKESQGQEKAKHQKLSSEDKIKQALSVLKGKEKEKFQKLSRLSKSLFEKRLLSNSELLEDILKELILEKISQQSREQKIEELISILIEYKNEKIDDILSMIHSQEDTLESGHQKLSRYIIEGYKNSEESNDKNHQTNQQETLTEVTEDLSKEIDNTQSQQKDS